MSIFNVKSDIIAPDKDLSDHLPVRISCAEFERVPDWSLGRLKKGLCLIIIDLIDQ